MIQVFQYGSNMSVERLNHADRLSGDAKVVGIANTVESFELVFTVWSTTNCCAAADIVPSHTGRSIYGVVYGIPDFLLSRDSAKKHNRKSMDTIEGEGKNYIRKTIELVKADGSKITAMTYVVKKREFDIKTSLPYVQHILNGLKEHKIPEEYRQYVISQVTKNNRELGEQISMIRNDT